MCKITLKQKEKDSFETVISRWSFLITLLTNSLKPDGIHFCHNLNEASIHGVNSSQCPDDEDEQQEQCCIGILNTENRREHGGE